MHECVDHKQTFLSLNMMQTRPTTVLHIISIILHIMCIILHILSTQADSNFKTEIVVMVKLTKKTKTSQVCTEK